MQVKHPIKSSTHNFRTINCGERDVGSRRKRSGRTSAQCHACMHHTPACNIRRRWSREARRVKSIPRVPFAIQAVRMRVTALIRVSICSPLQLFSFLTPVLLAGSVRMNGATRQGMQDACLTKQASHTFRNTKGERGHCSIRFD